MLNRILTAVACLSFWADAQNAFGPESRDRLVKELSGFRAANSTGFIGSHFFEIHDSNGVESGFGSLRPAKRKGQSDDPKKWEISLNGRLIKPEGTLKVVANGVVGAPGRDAWEFEISAGPIRALSFHPDGEAIRAVFEDSSFDLESKSGKAALKAFLKRVPEAHARFKDNDAVGAIRYFNAAPETEFVKDTGYSEDLDAMVARRPDGNWDGLAKAIAQRLALNPNDLPALGMKAQALCKERRSSEAETVIEAAAKIRSDYYRIHLARATCLQEQGRGKEANAQLGQALRLVRPKVVSELSERMDDNDRKGLFDSAYARQKRKWVWLEWDIFGIGITQAVFGSSLSLHANLGRFATSLSLGTGMGQFVSPPASFPALALRFYLPGGRFRVYGGYSAMNPFRIGPRNHYYFHGPEAGLSHDVGLPRGLKLNYGLTMVTAANDHPSDKHGETDPIKDRFIFPHGSVTYAF